MSTYSVYDSGSGSAYEIEASSAEEALKDLISSYEGQYDLHKSFLIRYRIAPIEDEGPELTGVFKVDPSPPCRGEWEDCTLVRYEGGGLTWEQMCNCGKEHKRKMMRGMQDSATGEVMPGEGVLYLSHETEPDTY